MIRAAVLGAAAMIAAPLAAQDHSAHAGHAGTQDHPADTDAGRSAAPAEVDHCAMGHLPPDQCPAPSSPRSTPSAEPDGHAAHDPHQGHAGEPDPAGPDAHAGHSGQAGHAAPADMAASGAAPEHAVPARALAGPRHAADAVWGADAMARSRADLGPMHGGMRTGMVMIERLEARLPAEGGEDAYLWDAQAFYGGDINRLVLKTEGEGAFGGSVEEAELQALYSRAIGPFFDLQAGVRFDPEPDTRSHLVVGVQGLAPYMFEIDAALFLSDRGDLTARVEGEYDQLITQRLILQPRVEVEFAAQDVPERGLAAGITAIAPGLRLRYEFAREFAPYLGIEYEARLGGTADIARSAGEDPDGLRLIVGLRTWF